MVKWILHRFCAPQNCPLPAVPRGFAKDSLSSGEWKYRFQITGAVTISSSSRSYKSIPFYSITRDIQPPMRSAMHRARRFTLAIDPQGTAWFLCNRHGQIIVPRGVSNFFKISPLHTSNFHPHPEHPTTKIQPNQHSKYVFYQESHIQDMGRPLSKYFRVFHWFVWLAVTRRSSRRWRLCWLLTKSLGPQAWIKWPGGTFPIQQRIS